MTNHDKKKELIMWMRNQKICIKDDGSPRTRMQKGMHGVQNIGEFFFDPILSKCLKARVSSGSFSSAVIKNWTKSLDSFVINKEKKIEILTHFELDKNTIEVLSKQHPAAAVDTYFSEQNKVIKKTLNDFLKNPDKNYRSRSHVLAYLINNKQLIIKFAFQKNHDYSNLSTIRSQEHVKMGYFELEESLKVGYEGGFNITNNGMEFNGESAQIKFSWTNTSDSLDEIIADMDYVWKYGNDSVDVRDVDEETLALAKEICKQYGSPESNRTPKNDKPKPSDELIFPDVCWTHKQDATKEFINKKSGTLDMATGTGKTSTALIIMSNLLEQEKIDSVIIAIGGSNKELLNQWHHEFSKWKNTYKSLYKRLHNLSAIKEYDNYNDYEEFLSYPKNKILFLSIHRREKFISTVNLLHGDGLGDRTLVIHDEVHNLPTDTNIRELKGHGAKLKYKLGLSATAIREHDFDGDGTEKNNFIENEIGKPVYSYTLGEAIADGVLCEFDYYVVKFQLNTEEKEKLAKHAAAYNMAKNRTPRDKAGEKQASINMAKVKKSAANKIPELRQFIIKNKLEHCLKKTLIFCDSVDYSKDIAKNILHYFNYTKYNTFNSTRDDLEEIYKKFRDGDKDCLICCDMLTEGIDIPTLNNVILFSSEVELIKTKQRVGRALRNHEEKKALIIDFKELKNNNRNENEEKRIAFLTDLAKVKKCIKN